VSKKARKKQKLAQANASPAGVRVSQTDLLFGRKRPRRRLNIRFLVLLGLWVVALIIGLLYITGRL
jgi:hypothetical protein